MAPRPPDARKLPRVTAKIFSRRRTDVPPSTQFAATIVAMPEPDAAGPEPAAPDTLAPDSQVTDASGSQGAMPDVVTDIGGLPSEVPDPAEAPTISHIGRYALKRQLGAGGLGAVFEAWDPLLSRAVAVKTLQLDAGADAAQGHALDGLFLNEARAAAGLNHRYIVTIHDAGLSPHGVYIAMERLYGRDLQRALAEGWKPSVEQVVQLVRRVADALAYAHARGVVHCDIKPANIFLQRKDRPKVLDFGIARLLHGTRLPALEGAVVGSPRYRAPEQLTGGAVDARTDLFSLGVVMYELLTGRRAFEGDSLAAINRAVLEQDPLPAHEVEAAIPQELSSLVARLMARDPARRYTCAGELATDLRRWLAAQQLPAETVTMTALPQTVVAAAASARPARRPAPWLVGGGLLLAAVAAAIGLAMRNPAPAALPPGDTQQATHPATNPVASPVINAAAPASMEATAASPPVAEATPPAPPPAPAPTVAAPRPAGMAAAPIRRPADAPPRPRTATATEAAPAAVAAAATAEAAVDATGTLTLAVSPWGEVEVDGKPAGTTPPLTRLSLPAGPHTITLRNADFPPHTVQVQIGADKPVALRHRFGS